MCTHVDTAQSPHPPGQSSCPAWDDICRADVERKDTGSPNAEVDIKDLRTRHLNTTTEKEDRRRSMKLELMKTPYYDEVGVVAVVLQTSPHTE